MKFPTGIVAAFWFVLILAVIALVIWFVGQFTGSGTAPDEMGSGFFGTLFPFGDGGGGGIGDLFGGADDDAGGSVPALRLISEEEVAGARFVTGLSGALSIRYVERRTGHVYETPVETTGAIRLTNTTIPAVHDAMWINASTTVMRLLAEDDHVDNFVGVITATSTDQQLGGFFLDQFDRITTSPSGTVLGVIEDAPGAVVLSVALDKREPVVVYRSPVSSWIPHSAKSGFYLTSAPSGRALGNLYKVEGGRLDLVGGGIIGLEVLLNEAGDRALVSGGGQNVIRTFVMDTLNGTVTPLPRATLAGKCTWVDQSLVLCAVPATIPQSLYPDDWLLGSTHTSDDLWFINTEDLTATEAFPLEVTAEMAIDVGMLSISTDGRYALFINRNDQKLWSATLPPR